MTSNPYTSRELPTQTIDLGAGKVTGQVRITYVGDGHVSIGTHGAHVNDHNPGIEYNGDGYIGRVWVKRNDDGSWRVDADSSWNKRSQWSDATGRYTRRDNWSDAGKLAERMITRRLLEAMAEHFDPALAALADAVDAEWDAMHAWRKADEAKAVADAARKALRAAERKLTKAGGSNTA